MRAVTQRDLVVDGRGPRHGRIGAGGRGGGRSVGAEVYAQITARAGTEPPYLYAAEEVAFDVDFELTVVPDGLEFANLRNAADVGDSGVWGCPLNVGDVVRVDQPDAEVELYMCDRLKNVGTY